MLVLVSAALSAAIPVMLWLVMREGWSGSVLMRSFRHPWVMLMLWSTCCAISISSLMFLVRVTAWLESDKAKGSEQEGDTDDFMMPLVALLAYLSVLEIYMRFASGSLRHDVSQMAQVRACAVFSVGFSGLGFDSEFARASRANFFLAARLRALRKDPRNPSALDSPQKILVRHRHTQNSSYRRRDISTRASLRGGFTTISPTP